MQMPSFARRWAQIYADEGAIPSGGCFRGDTLRVTSQFRAPQEVGRRQRLHELQENDAADNQPEGNGGHAGIQPGPARLARKRISEERGRHGSRTR